MASGPITSWQLDGKIVETVTEFIYLFIYLFLATLLLQMVTAAINLKRNTCSLEEKL